MPVSGTSASLLHSVWAVCQYSLILRVSKLKFSCSSSETESLEALAFKCLLVLRTSFNLLYTRAFRSSPLSGNFLAPWNLTRPAPPPQAVEQVEFMALACSIMILHESMRWPVLCRGQTGEFFCFFLFIRILFRGVRGLFWPFALRQLGGLVAFTGMLGFFVLVISFILRLENFPCSLKAIAELKNIREALGSRFEPLDDEFFLSLLHEWKLQQLEDLVVW